MFNNIRKFAVTLGVVLVGVVAVPRLKASDEDKKVTMTFSAPVEIPGNRILAAGTYIFKTAPGSQNIIVITNADGTKPIAMILSQPDFWTTVPDKVIVHLGEHRADAPPAVKSWSYPGDQYGFGFVYPEKNEAK
jgi:hypothetical protein